MKGTALFLLCAATLVRAEQPKLTFSSGQVCSCNEAASICSQDGSDNYLLTHANCNQFYKCAHGSAIPYFCPANLLYNPLAEVCDWAQNVECGSRPIVEDGTEEECNENSNSNENNGNEDNGEKPEDGDNGTGGGTCNCNPGEAPALCAADGSDGVLVAHQNCNQFYKCDHGEPVVLNCPPKLLYNPHTEQCDWAEHVDCGDRPIIDIDGGNNGGDEDCDLDGGNGESGSGGGNGDNGNGSGGGTCNCDPGEAPSLCAAAGSEGILVAHENCNQFYKCDHGVPVALYCPNGLVYNSPIEQCDWPANVDCGNRPIVESEGGNNGGNEDCDLGGENGESGSGNGNGDNGSGDNGSGDSGSGGGGTCNCNPGEAPGICSADSSDGTLVAHENCNQFYKCANGLPVTISCPNGLAYNPHIECCDWPANVDCGDKPIDNGGNGNGGDSNENGGDNGGNGDNGSGGGGTCNCNPGEAPGICATDGSDGTLIAHENCNQFYQCAHGKPVTISCAPPLVYNPYIERCDWPANVDCGDKLIVEIDNGGNGNGGDSNENGGDNGGNGDNGSGGGGTCNCNPGEAPGICSTDGSDGTLIAHENCNQFYQCAHGKPVTISCAPYLVYNPYIERCDWPANVDCGEKPIVEVDGGGNGDGGGDDGSGGNGNSNENGGGTCNCNPGEAPGICGAAGSEGVLIAHENCNQFYKCANGVPVALLCPSDLMYNPHLEKCDWPASVECGNRPVVEGDGGNSEEGNTEEDDKDEESSNGDNCDPSQAPSICATSGSDGVLVAHENCDQFYKCAEGLPVALDCPANLLFNSVLQVCDWPENVVCGDRVNPTPEEEDNNNGGGDNGGGDNGGGDNGGGDNGGGDNGTSGGNGDPSEAPAICANSGADGVLVAHENCDKFYVCLGGSPVTLNCPSNLLYNPNSELCDWPNNVNCGNRIIPEPESGGGDSPCSCNAREAPAICAGTNSNGKLIAHENCNQYYVCFNGAPVARSCPLSLFYEPHTEQCLWPASLSCDGRAITAYSSLNKHRNARRGFF